MSLLLHLPFHHVHLLPTPTPLPALRWTSKFGVCNTGDPILHHLYGETLARGGFHQEEEGSHFHRSMMLLLLLLSYDINSFDDDTTITTTAEQNYEAAEKHFLLGSKESAIALGTMVPAWVRSDPQLQQHLQQSQPQQHTQHTQKQQPSGTSLTQAAVHAEVVLASRCVLK